MFHIPTTKNNKIDRLGFYRDFFVFLVIFCLSVIIMYKLNEQSVESIDKPLPVSETTSVPPMYLTRNKPVVQQWREAARPVFQSRGTTDITDRATPEDLKHYLDPCYAVIWQEKSLIENCAATGIWIKTK